MNNTNHARLSPAELRRRLLTHPGSAAPPVYPTEVMDEPPIPPSLARRQPTAPAVAPLPMQIESRTSISRPTPMPDMGMDVMEMARATRHSAPAEPMGISLEEATQLHAELQDLRSTLAQYKQLLEQVEAEQQSIQLREDAFQKAIEERDQLIDELQAETKRVKAEFAAIPKLKNADELQEWNDELEREQNRFNQEKKRFAEEQRQLREDEEALERQMRDQEISMARERALMARQETELKRLSAEIQQELEVIQRSDSGLRDRMAKFQRRHQEVLARAAGLDPNIMAQQPMMDSREQGALSIEFSPEFLPGADSVVDVPNPTAERGRKDTRMMRRLFGGK